MVMSVSLSFALLYIMLNLGVANLSTLYKSPIVATRFPRIVFLSNITIFSRCWILYVSK